MYNAEHENNNNFLPNEWCLYKVIVQISYL
jgi:hypothetical protein